MPGPAIHHIIAEKYLRSVLMERYTRPADVELWNAMDRGPTRPFYFFGAQGPDFLFFNQKDWDLSGEVKTIAETCLDAQEFLADVAQNVRDAIPWETLDRSATLSEIGDLLRIAGANVKGLLAILEKGLEGLLLTSVDVYQKFKHPQQNGLPWAKWTWMDTLHIRRTGRYLTALLEQSRPGSSERAYALGHLTHYAADVVGHPFVNILAGGPWRTHPHRHKIVESVHDTWAWRHYNGGELTDSGLARQYVIDGDASNLPSGLKDLILAGIERVYYDGGKPLYGRAITGDDLDFAYRCWLKWLTIATNGIALDPPRPYVFTQEVEEAWQKFLRNVDDIGRFVERAARGRQGILGLLQIYAALAIGLVLFAAAIIDFLARELLTIADAPIRALLSISYQALYDAFLNARKTVVLTGFAVPRVADLDDRFLRHMFDSAAPDVFGSNASSLPDAQSYPSIAWTGPAWLRETSHLVYPYASQGERLAEYDLCTGAPTSYFAATPAWYIDGPELTFDPRRYEYFASFVETDQEEDIDPDLIDLRYLELADVAASGGLGNAVAFSGELYARFLECGADASFPDFCLDSDRGYAFKSWRKVARMPYLNRRLNSVSLTNVPIQNSVPNHLNDVLYPIGSAR